MSDHIVKSREEDRTKRNVIWSRFTKKKYGFPMVRSNPSKVTLKKKKKEVEQYIKSSLCCVFDFLNGELQ